MSYPQGFIETQVNYLRVGDTVLRPKLFSLDYQEKTVETTRLEGALVHLEYTDGTKETVYFTNCIKRP